MNTVATATKDEKKEGLKRLKHDFWWIYEDAPKRKERTHCPRRGCSGLLIRDTAPAHLREDWKHEVYRCQKCHLSCHRTPSPKGVRV